MGVTIRQIAEIAGVSRGTVDRALNHRGRIDPQVADRILKIADELGYVPRSRKNMERAEWKIGVITQLAKYSFMKEINKGIAAAGKEMKSRGIRVLIEEGLSVNENEMLHSIDRLAEQKIDALALMPIDSDPVRERLNELAEKRNIPIIAFNTDIVGTRRLAFIGMDNTQSGRAAAGLMGMLTRGTGRILVITGYFGNRVNSMRVEGFVSELKQSFPGLEIAGVHSSFDDAGELEKIVVNTMLGVQGINGILIVSAGQSGLDRAFQRLRMDRRPYVISYDLTPWSRKALQGDKIDFLIDQDGYFQGYHAVNALANYLTQGHLPEKEFIYTDISIRTKYNS